MTEPDCKHLNGWVRSDATRSYHCKACGTCVVDDLLIEMSRRPRDSNALLLSPPQLNGTERV